ncbi:MAG: hypothetical protein H6573_01055 [Lewinellaceae bacterium]|nr:hypothetical protein [Phaeodactylibacter sp.]MCB0614233.1 hypothetical protein [Phaeodactylibacter sp.]MCB9346085.1 hypothetical protein [Lewinellaceae bacterium]
MTGISSPLFHPRKDTWTDHFEWDIDYQQVIGITPTGRATVRTLHLNRRELANLRAITRLTGEHPPPGK